LEAVLPATPIADLDARMARFAEDHQTPPARVARAARICRLLLREAARRGVSREGFVADLRALSAPGDDAAEQVLAPIFDRAMLALRQELQYSSLLGHGLLLTDVDWRLDVMKHSKRGADLDTPVVMLTLHYAEGLKRERITLQVLPDMLGELQTMCRHVLD
ncbi:MAG: hypothetical protein KC731_10865, partial [Myxococcales bacterium]|nr:hypothetical protein [Myxococcales bacterium]